MAESDTFELKDTMKVLIVDDSEIVRERLKALLFEVPKVQTIGQANDPQEATELFRRLNPGVIVLDIQMPGGSGIDLLQKVKRRRRPPLVIVLTNLSYSRYRKVCLKAGADFFFDKSTEFDKVAEVLSQFGRNRSAPRSMCDFPDNQSR